MNCFYIRRLVLLTFTLLLGINSFAQENIIEIGDSYYSISGNEATLVSGNMTESNVTIPSSFMYEGKEYTVVCIGESAFSSHISLNNITIPESITSIGRSAFAACENLKEISIPSSVTKIEGDAFEGCSSLTSFAFPNSITSISFMVLWGCTNLKNITIPNSVTKIEGDAFSSCTNLENIIIPNSVTTIGELAFKGCTSLTNVEFPDMLTTIEDNAFEKCTGLTSIEIPDKVTSIGKKAFYNCKNINTIVSHILEPFPININVFDELYKSATLYVPIGTKAKYKDAYGWNRFLLIEEGEPASISTNAIQTTNIIDSYKISGYHYNKPQKGLYILKMSDGTTRKVMLR